MRPLESFVGQPIRSLQTMLRVIETDAGKELPVIPDGIYGNQTQQSISRFQQERGLPVTGVADQATWERIAAEYPDALTRVGAAEPVRIILDPGAEFRLGDESYLIYLMQAMLLAVGEIYESIITPQINGKFDQVTADSVASFQMMSQLPQTGIMDKVTWKHLALQYPLAVNWKETDHREVKSEKVNSW